MRWQNLLYGLFAVALISVGVFWFLNNFELKTVDEFTGFKGEARYNNLFAARLYSRQMGIPAQRHEGLATLPSTDTVIVLNTERFSLSAEKITDLLNWVERGGHLITKARVDLETIEQAEADQQSETEDRDLLQARLGITIGAHQMPDEDQLPARFQPTKSPAQSPLAVELDFFNDLNSRAEGVREYKLGNATWLLQQPHGAGLVTMLSTLEMIENPSLDKADHAQLLWYLLRSHHENYQGVWLIHQDTLPSLLTLLLRHASALLAVLALLLVFSFWALMPRFGALIPEPEPARRRIMDHISASGQFLWKRQQNGRTQLTHALQQSIKQRTQQLTPGWQLMPDTEQYQTLQQTLTGLSGEPIAHPQNLKHLLTATHLDESDFVRLAQLASHLRNHP